MENDDGKISTSALPTLLAALGFNEYFAEMQQLLAPDNAQYVSKAILLSSLDSMHALCKVDRDDVEKAMLTSLFPVIAKVPFSTKALFCVCA